MAGIDRTMSANQDLRSGFRKKADELLANYANSTGVGNVPKTGGIGDWVGRMISGEKGAGIGEVLGLPGSSVANAAEIPSPANTASVVPAAPISSSSQMKDQFTPNQSLGLSTPPPSTPSTPGGVAKPSTPPASEWWKKDGWKVSGIGGITPSGETPTATRTTTMPDGTPLLEARGISALKPKTDVVSQVLAELNDQANAIRSNPANQIVGGRGLNSKAEDRLAELTKAKVAGVVGLEGHRLAATERGELSKLSLAERERHNKLLENDYQLRLGQQKDIAAQKAMETSLSTWGYHESDPANPGNKVMNRKLTYFNMAESGEDIPDSLKPAVNGVKKEFEDYYTRGLKGQGNPALRAKAKAEFMKKNLIFGNL